MDDADIDSVTRILGGYDIRLDRAQLGVALRDNDFSEWAHASLHPDNLLTVDELALYVRLLASLYRRHCPIRKRRSPSASAYRRAGYESGYH